MCDVEERRVFSRHVVMPRPTHNVFFLQKPYAIFIFFILCFLNRFGSFLALRVYHLGCAALYSGRYLPTIQRKLPRISSEDIHVDWQTALFPKIEPPYSPAGQKKFSISDWRWKRQFCYTAGWNQPDYDAFSHRLLDLLCRILTASKLYGSFL
jgi:hypothetical protein